MNLKELNSFIESEVEAETLGPPVDTPDFVKMDVPFLIRVLEYAREDAKSDLDLHKVTEKMIKISSESGKILKMEDYNFIFGDNNGSK